jgi:hypothetical protein
MPVPFDTHAVIQELEHLGFPTPQAEGLSHVLTQVFTSQDYATKADIAAVRADITEVRLGLEIKLETIKGDITHLKWGIGLLMGGVLSLILKAYVHL